MGRGIYYTKVSIDTLVLGWFESCDGGHDQTRFVYGFVTP
jgi:hypothetical protein